MSLKIASLPLVFLPFLLHAQQKTDLQLILERLDRIEQQNKSLADEVRSLRAELAAARPPVSESAPITAPITERLAVAEQRITDLSQTKVEAAQKLPIQLTGMVLFNAWMNGRANGNSEFPSAASQANSTAAAAGATFSQTVLGLKYQGPEIFAGGHINASMYLDAWGGNPANSLNHLFRLRVATVEAEWKNTTVMVGQDKPLISPREPNSLAQVAVSPLAGAGNLWLWQPQIRVDQRFAFGQRSGLTAQLSVYQTSEPNYSTRGGDTNVASSPRPGLEGRFEFWRKFGESARIEIAPGFHESVTHVGGQSANSRLGTVDWLLQPSSKFQVTGMFFTGENAAGLGGLRQGFSDLNGHAVPVGVNGGWTQFSYFATRRLTFNLFGGLENDRQGDLLSGDIHRNGLYAANAIYRLGSNILIGFEASQVRTNYFLLPSKMNNHYDLALGYLF